MADGALEHVVVVMMENRSFDHLLGFLDHPDEQFPRLQAGAYLNQAGSTGSTAAAGTTPDAAHTVVLDPPHGFRSVMEQLHLDAAGRPRMDGFLAAYLRKASGHEPRAVIHWARVAALAEGLSALVAWGMARMVGRRRQWPLFFGAVGGAAAGLLARAKRKVDHVEVVDAPPEVMRCMTPEKLPVLATLAKEFALCTRWHSSVPGETWPNRNFAHAATSEESLDIEVGFYDAPTIFDQLEEHGATWRVYHEGTSHLWAFRHLWAGGRIGRWDPVSKFADHVASGTLAHYSFVEPDHSGHDSSSQHPNNNRTPTGGADFRRGEELLAGIYTTLRSHPEVFEKTLLVVTYDEHGGFFDRVPPPTDVAAPAPLRRLPLSRRFVSLFVERRSGRFDFRMLGPRVPAVVVSPLIPAGTLDDRLYDHTSIPATVRKLFAPAAPPLTARDAAANTFEHLASLATPRQGDALPVVVPLPVEAPRPLAPPSEAVEPPPEEDELARQLRVLGRQVDRELLAAGSPSPGLVAGPDDVVARFRAAAEQARRA